MELKELEALLNKHYENYRHSDSLHGETLDYVIDAMQEALSIGGASNWVAVKERLPDNNDMKNIFKGDCIKNIHWFIGKYINGKHYYNECAYCKKKQSIDLD